MEYNKILQGNTLTVLKTLPPEIINMCITSPPYWGLRDYGTDPQIWDAGDEEVFISYRGDKDFYRSEKTIKTPCEHEWVEHIKKPNGGKGSKGANVGANKNDFANMRDHDVISNFCTKCNAWKGQLGQEPNFELFVKHLCDIFDEVKRVLKPTGTCFVNLGDTYGGTGNKGDCLDPKYPNGRNGQKIAINKRFYTTKST